MKVALVYDRVNKWGGAERVLLALHKLFPDAPLFTSVYNPKSAPWARAFRVKTSFLQHFPFASSHHELYAPFMPLAFQSFSFDSYDVVISITSEFAKGIKTGNKTLHVSYCLTPTRYLWSGYKEYFRNSFFRSISFPLIWILRKWDKKLSKSPNIYLAISEEVKKRIKKYYYKDSLVLYPPLTPFRKIKEEKHHLSGYFLVVSRLVSYKRVDIAIKACKSLNLPLVIIGKGLDERRLKNLAGPNTFFLKNLTDQELLGYYKNCKALIFPGREDFGLAILEAQSVGKPVIAYKAGGALEIIKENKTGIFFNSQTPKSLIEILKRFKENKFREKDCIDQTEAFNVSIFNKKMLSIIRETRKK